MLIITFIKHIYYVHKQINVQLSFQKGLIKLIEGKKFPVCLLASLAACVGGTDMRPLVAREPSVGLELCSIFLWPGRGKSALKNPLGVAVLRRIVPRS